MCLKVLLGGAQEFAYHNFWKEARFDSGRLVSRFFILSLLFSFQGRLARARLEFLTSIQGVIQKAQANHSPSDNLAEKGAASLRLSSYPVEWSGAEVLPRSLHCAARRSLRGRKRKPGHSGRDDRKRAEKKSRPRDRVANKCWSATAKGLLKQGHSRKRMSGKQKIIDAIGAVAKRLGRTPSLLEFERRSGISKYSVTRLFPKWNNAVREARIEPCRLYVRPANNELLRDWGEMVRRKGALLSRNAC